MLTLTYVLLTVGLFLAEVIVTEGRVFVAAPTVNVADPLTCPSGLVTSTARVPADAMSDAAMIAERLVADRNVVGLSVPPNLTTAPFLRFAPVTVSVNPALPGAADAGLRLVTLGATEIGRAHV